MSCNVNFGNNIVYVEAGYIYRDTRDYIQRNILALSGGKSAATYVNYGKVLTNGSVLRRVTAIRDGSVLVEISH